MQCRLQFIIPHTLIWGGSYHLVNPPWLRAHALVQVHPLHVVAHVGASVVGVAVVGAAVVGASVVGADVGHAICTSVPE